MQKMMRFNIVTQAEGCKPQMENDVQALNEQQLRMLYASTGVRILQIQRVGEGDTIKDRTTNPEYSSDPNGIPPQALTVENPPIETPRSSSQQPVQSQEQGCTMIQPSAPRQTQHQPEQRPVLQTQQAKPKFYNIGDIEIKEQGGRIYQKQWIRVPMKDESDYRIISDSTNKIVPMKGKHLEVKKWVLVDNSEDDDDQEKCVELING